MTGPVQMTGFKFRIGKYKIRFWKLGFEFGDDCGGRCWIWPWKRRHLSKINNLDDLP